MPKQTIQQYIVLPPRGLTAGGVLPSTPSVTSFLLSLNKVRMSREQTAALASAKIKTKLRVLDSIGENGAKLVEMSPESVSNLRAEQPGLRVVPVVYYFPR
jgi:subtilisin